MSDKLRETLKRIDEMLYVQETDAPPSTKPDTSVDGEPTDEMVEDGMQAMGYKAEGRSYGGARQRFIKGLKAALAVQQKGDKTDD